MTDPADLYGLPLDQFVAERTALAKNLRAAGDRDEAARIAKLPKPSVAAWAVNQIVRTQAAGVADLFAAGDALKATQRDVMAGRRDAAGLREAAAVKRAALDGLVAAARGLLDAQGHGLAEATLTRVSESLDAAALDDSAREQIEGGCLARELQHAGLGEGLGGDWAAPAPARAPRRRNAEAATDEDREAAEAQARAARERQQALLGAEAAESRTRRAAQRAAQAFAEAQSRHDAAADALAAADDALAIARDHADAAARDHVEAQEALEALERAGE